jgi:hypothetical protein
MIMARYKVFFVIGGHLSTVESVIEAMASQPVADQVQVLSADGTSVSLQAGRRLTFGRGRGADIVIPGGRDLSRSAGEIVALPTGAWVENLSRTHALYVRGDDYHIRLPPSGRDGPAGGWLISRGAALVGSMAMIRKNLALCVSVSGNDDGAIRACWPCAAGRDGAEESTLRPLLLRRDTKLYLVALMLCRPWLMDPGHTTALPTAPQIARAALDCTNASIQLEWLDSDPEFRANLVGQVNDHLKYLRERIQASELAPAGTRLTPSVIAQALLANDIITAADLDCLADPRWRSLQEDLWWKGGS